MTDRNNFCIQITGNNLAAVKKWWESMNYAGSKAWSMGAYYGTSHGKEYASSASGDTVDTPVISFEEFQRTILNPERIVNDYQIY